MPEQLKECPYCSSLSIELHSRTNDMTLEKYNQAFCTSCGVRGPKIFSSELVGIAVWNSLPRAPEWQEQPKVNEWNRWTDGTCNNVIFIRQDGTGVVSGCVMHWKEISDRWFPIPTPEDVT